MKRMLITKGIAVYMCLAMLMMVTGCGKNKENETNSTVATIQATSTIFAYANPYISIEDFYSISNISESYTLSCEYMTNEENAQYSGSVYGGKIFEGEYALCLNQKDKIVVADYEGHSQGYIEINGVKKHLSVYHIEKVGIVDIDTNDLYKEIVIYDLGASADPTLILLRYSEGIIYEIGSFYGVEDYDTVLFNRNGKVIDATGYVDFVEPQIVTEYYDVVNNVATVVKVDCATALNKTYKLTEDITVAFYETDNENIEEAQIDLESTVDLKAKDEIKIIKIGQSKSLYYVQLPDGRRGVITPQLVG